MDLPSRSQHEAELFASVNALGEKWQRELAKLLGKPPDPRNVPADFWSRVQRETEAALLIVLLIVFSRSAELHGMSADRAARMAQQWGPSRASFVASRYAQNSRDMLEAQISDWLSDPPTRAEVRNRLQTIFGESRSRGLVVTEISNGVTDASEAAIHSAGLASEGDTWQTELDSKVCPVCKPLESQPRSVWQPLFPSGPPAHVNCRCFIAYELEGAPV